MARRASRSTSAVAAALMVGALLVVLGAGAPSGGVPAEPGLVQQAKLLAPDGAALFGHSVALAGDTALVGAIADSRHGDNSGSASVFVRSGEAWREQAKLLAPDGAAGDIFAYSVALSGDTALAGAAGDGDRGTGSGSAYVFTRSGKAWKKQAKLLAPDGAAGDQFGYAVALSGDTALVGAFFDDDKGESSGAAYVFVRSGPSWTQQAKLVPADGAAGDQFGQSMALSSDAVLIGARDDDDKGENSGSAYLFVRSGEAWSQQAKLLAVDGAPGDVFGYSAALSGDNALVGALSDDDQGESSGAAYLFVRSGEAWSQQAKLLAVDGAPGDQFGSSVAVSGDTSLVGALLNKPGGKGSGSAYVFAPQAAAMGQAPSPAPTVPTVPNASSPTPSASPRRPASRATSVIIVSGLGAAAIIGAAVSRRRRRRAS